MFYEQLTKTVSFIYGFKLFIGQIFLVENTGSRIETLAYKYYHVRLNHVHHYPREMNSHSLVLLSYWFAWINVGKIKLQK